MGRGRLFFPRGTSARYSKASKWKRGNKHFHILTFKTYREHTSSDSNSSFTFLLTYSFHSSNSLIGIEFSIHTDYVDPWYLTRTTTNCRIEDKNNRSWESSQKPKLSPSPLSLPLLCVLISFALV